MARSKASQKNLFIAFDAFGTLFSPRAPIGAQYGEVARKNRICKDVSDDEIMNNFKKAFKHNAKERPNYGKEVGMDPTAWWSSIITQTFTPFLATADASSPQLPARLIPDLLTRFASDTGYTLYADVIPLFTRLRALGFPSSSSSSSSRPKIITAVVTNSDDRVAGILRSFGLRVGHIDPGTIAALTPTTSNPQPTTLLSQENADDNDIDFVLTSYDCGFEKPHPGIFDAAVAVARARFAADDGEGEWEMVYVGDEADKDVVGPEGAGWGRAFLVDREGGVVGSGEARERDGGVVVSRRDVGLEGEGDVRVLRGLMELEGYLNGIAG